MKRLLLLVILLSFACAMKSQTPEEVSLSDSSGVQLKMVPVLKGYTRGMALLGTGNYDYIHLFGEASLSATWRRNHLAMAAEARFREGVAYNERMSVLDLRELYAGYTSSWLDITLGNQIITWGKTDGFNPTNHITPVDYFLMTDDPGDQKMSNFLLQARVMPIRNTMLTLIAVPVFRPSVYRYELFDMGQEAMFLKPIAPEITFSNAGYAAKLDLVLPGIDCAISWSDGYSPEYGFMIDSITLFPKTSILYKPAYYRGKTAGLAFSAPAGRNIFRGEAAFQITTGYEKQMHIPNPGLSYVAGWEREILGITSILQYIGSYTLDFSPLKKPVITNPLDLLAMMEYAVDMIHYESAKFNRRVFYQQEQANHALSLSLVRSFAYETISAEATGYYNITSEESMARMSLGWSLSDNLKATLGGSMMWGPDSSIFDKAGPVMNGVYVGLKAQF